MAREAQRREQAAEAVDAGAAVRGPVPAVERVVGGLHEVAVLEELVAEAGVERVKKRRPVAAPSEGVGTGTTIGDDRMRLRLGSVVAGEVEESGEGEHHEQWPCGSSSSAQCVPTRGVREGEARRLQWLVGDANDWSAHVCCALCSRPRLW